MKKQFINIVYFIISLFILIGGIFYLNSKNQDNDLKLDPQGSILLNSGDFSGAISYYEKKLLEKDSYENKIFLVNSYLEYANSFYKEDEYSKKALGLLNTMEDKYDVLYFKGYTNEIIKNYTGALTYYNKGLEIKDLDNKKKSLLLNQIGHLYDLKGDIENAYKNYKEAYDTYNMNFLASINLGRYFARKGDFNNARSFFEYGLNIESKPIKSEIYYSLSTIELELNSGLKPDINKSIEYAKKSIDEYPNYAMGYLALARGYYMLNDKEKYAQLIEDNIVKSINLNPNGVEAYTYGALSEFDNGDLKSVGVLLNRAIEVSDKDMILMDSQRKEIKIKNQYLMLFLSNYKVLDDKNKIDSKTLENFIKDSNYDYFVKKQLKRVNYGIFSKYSKEIDLIINQNKLGE